MKLQNDKLSVIISVLNAKNVIEQCIISILEQSYENCELIIIDGGSSDGTVEIIRKYSNKIHYWVSEKDTGIYNAWNKGLVKVSGEWVCFIGSDDTLLPNAIENMMDKAKFPDVNFVSARVMMVSEFGEMVGAIGKSWNYKNLSNGLGIVHCGSLHHITLFKKFGYFNENYQIAGDFEFLLRVGKNIKSSFHNEVILNMCNNGISRKKIRDAIQETSIILYKSPDFGRSIAIKHYFYAILRGFIRKIIFLFPFGRILFVLKNK